MGGWALPACACLERGHSGAPCLLRCPLAPPLLLCPADPSKTVDISEADKADVQFTYSVAWKATDIPYERRMDK